MRHRTIGFIMIAAAVLVTGGRGETADRTAYRECIAQAEQALRLHKYPTALTFIRQAHFADFESREPFLLLRQIPALGEQQRSARHYYNMATAYYMKGDFRNARFFYAAAQDLNPHQMGVEQTLAHVDAVLAGTAVALREERELRRLGNGLSVEAGPVVVGGRRAERVGKGEYSVAHPPEINTILSKYGPAGTARQAKIDAAWQDVRRRQGRRPPVIPSLKWRGPGYPEADSTP